MRGKKDTETPIFLHQNNENFFARSHDNSNNAYCPTVLATLYTSPT